MNNYYDSRQHLTLSQLAFDTIENDKYEFMEKPSRQGLINQIIETLSNSSSASIDASVLRYNSQLISDLSHIPESNTKSAIISSLTEKYRIDLVRRMTEYPGGRSFKFQLNKQNYEALSHWTDENGYYGGHPAKFYKAILEEYARKSYYEREEIVLSKLISDIELHIAASKLIVINLCGPKNRCFEVRPFSISSDPLKSYHYLIGYSKEVTPQASENIASFRISRISSVRTSSSRSGRITAEQKKAITTKIQNVGIQFLTQSSEIIRIRLTASGKRDLENQAHLRPNIVDVEKENGDTWVYTFDCSQLQAEYYFFKFGSKAEVLEPVSLRNRFVYLFESSVNIYKSTPRL